MSDLEWARDRVRRALEAGPAQRLVLVAVASLDFAASIEGRSRRLSSAADRALMFAWREVADVLLVGSHTIVPAPRARRSATAVARMWSGAVSRQVTSARAGRGL